MKRSQEHSLKIVKIHPLSIKALKSGHYHITTDRFSDKFPKNEKFLGVNETNNNLKAILLHDPSHKNIKARLWEKDCSDFNASVKSFTKDLYSRINFAIQKRMGMGLSASRDNFYIIFGEVDNLPGIRAQLLADKVLIQLYSNFWDYYEELLVNSIKKILDISYTDFKVKEIYIQKRVQHDKPLLKMCFPRQNNLKNEINFVIKEFGIKYLLKISSSLDFGIYSDMSAIREELIPFFKQSKTVLNLFAYTGSFSLNALFHGAKHVVSVDISKKYSDWLKENITLNSFNKNSHQLITDSVQKHIKTEEHFDLIICDPPSFSSDGKSTLNALGFYENHLITLLDLTNPGGHLVIFINTHKISWTKFEERINKIISNHKNKKYFKHVKRLYLHDDCPTIENFSEGNYLKGIIFKNTKE